MVLAARLFLAHHSLTGPQITCNRCLAEPPASRLLRDVLGARLTLVLAMGMGLCPASLMLIEPKYRGEAA